MVKFAPKQEPRRSARLAKRALSAVDVEQPPDGSGSSASIADGDTHGCALTQSRKRRKVHAKGSARPRPRRFPKKGRLEPLLDLSTEIICEIASYLHPGDLLTMARSCKTLRNFFMSKASAPVWASSRKAINLPHCPPDLSEPQYADLLFSKGCYLCHASRAKYTYFPLRLRVCSRCRNRWIVYTIHTNGICEDEPETAAKAQKRKEFVCRKYMYLDLVPRFETESTCFAPGCFKHCLFYRPQLLEVRNKERTMTEREWRAYYVAHVDEMTAFMENATLVNYWLEDEAERRMDERDEIVRKRCSAIEERLISQGYSADLLEPQTLEPLDLEKQWEKILYDPKPLTARIWSNIEPKLKAILEARKRLDEELDANSSYNSDDYDDDEYEAGE